MKGKINVDTVPHAMCVGCKKQGTSCLLTWSMCAGRNHKACVSKAHKADVDSEDEFSFICSKCLVLTDVWRFYCTCRIIQVRWFYWGPISAIL